MKLLNKSIRTYLLYATIILLISVPVLYIAIQRIVAEDVDESLMAKKEKIVRYLENKNDSAFRINNQTLDSDVTLLLSQTATVKKDSVYTVIIHDKLSNEETPYRILETHISVKRKYFTLQLKNSLIDSKDLIESIVKIVAALLLLIIAGLILINRLLSKNLWRPFYSTISKLDEFKIENNEVLHFEKNNITEFTDLNKTITALTNRNLEVYQSQKEFTENASHEMQTPLAVLQCKIDLLMQTNPLNKEQSELISDLADVNQRMTHLNKSLLLLTKIENNQFFETENISVKQMLEKLTAQYRFQAEQRNITIENEFAGDITIMANKTLIEIMLGNLLSNAIKHNVINGSVIINGSKRVISFINTSGAAQLNSEKMFQRFQKQTTNSNSTGLGLQIAKKIADHYHYDINYNFHAQQHIFILSVN